ncbi:MAG TPA: hypothetical protein RMH99_04030, partial [Sandaracinaceae bacterium LLY-WYZ-13_1]|nr:hypothetical protein [Sandaracinaceae bacterium LLY-WYZ-13_1]
FEPVPAGSLEGGRVHVIVHGWAPGWFDGAPPTEPSWAARRDGRAFDPWMHHLAAAIHARDPGATVLFYSWLDDAATSGNLFAQRRAFARTSLHGETLARALHRALDAGFHEAGGQVHLIGHSMGARVVTIAAVRAPRPPRHLTLLDAPEAEMTALTNTRAHLAPLLRQLPLGRGPGRTFVDNYVSQMGQSYRFEPGLAAVVDVETSPPYGTFQMGPRHVWAAELYAATAERAFGFGWSPLLGEPAPRGCYRQPFGEVALEPRCEGSTPIAHASRAPD